MLMLVDIFKSFQKVREDPLDPTSGLDTQYEILSDCAGPEICGVYPGHPKPLREYCGGEDKFMNVRGDLDTTRGQL